MKIIQLDGDKALCDDGSVWELKDKRWTALPPLPVPMKSPSVIETIKGPRKPVRDPNFQNNEMYSAADATELAWLACTRYKSTQYPSQVTPHIINLLEQVSIKTLRTAIENASQTFDLNDRPSDMRPNFEKFFSSAAVVEDIAKSKPKAAAESKGFSMDNITANK